MRIKVSGRPNFFRFSEEGQILSGKLKEFREVLIQGQNREVAIIEDQAGLEWAVIMTSGLTALKSLPILSNVELIYRGEAKLKGGKSFKKFDIYRIVEDDKKPEEEIPF